MPVNYNLHFITERNVFQIIGRGSHQESQQNARNGKYTWLPEVCQAQGKIALDMIIWTT